MNVYPSTIARAVPSGSGYVRDVAEDTPSHATGENYQPYPWESVVGRNDTPEPKAHPVVWLIERNTPPEGTPPSIGAFRLESETIGPVTITMDQMHPGSVQAVGGTEGLPQLATGYTAGLYALSYQLSTQIAVQFVGSGLAGVKWNTVGNASTERLWPCFVDFQIGVVPLDLNQSDPEVEQAVGEIRRLPHLVAEYTAGLYTPPSHRTVALAVALVMDIRESFKHLDATSSLPDHIAPIQDGGIHLEWTGRQAEISVDISPKGQFGYLRVVRSAIPPSYDEDDYVRYEEIKRLIGKSLGIFDRR